MLNDARESIARSVSPRQYQGDRFMSLRSDLVTAACFALLAWPGTASSAADAYPTRPIRLILPVAAGGGNDVFARMLAPKLQEALGQPWVVDNRGGAGGNIAMEITARAAPDGYTVFQAANTFLTVNPHVYKLSFNVEKDLQPVVLLATAPLILVVH